MICQKCDASLSVPNRWCDSSAHIDGGQAHRDFVEAVKVGHVPTTFIYAEGDPILTAELIAVETWNREVLSHSALDRSADDKTTYARCEGEKA